MEELVEDILKQLGGGRRLLAIDGADGSGKTSFAQDLVDRIEPCRPALVLHMDDFLNIAPVRHAKGRTSPEGFWADSYNYDAFTRFVLNPLGTDGHGWYRPKAYDAGTDSEIAADLAFAPTEAVIVVEGMFLHRAELVAFWDLSVFLDAPFAVTAARMADRDGTSADPEHPPMRRYVEGQSLYFAVARPWECATYVVDNSDFTSPRIMAPTVTAAAQRVKRGQARP